MWLEAIIPKDDLTQLAAELLPVTVRLGDDGELFFHDPTDVVLVPEVGLRVVCAVRLRWSVLGLSVPATVRSLGVLLRPEVITLGGSEKIAFKVVIEHADVAGLPSVFDREVVNRVNRELDAKHVELAWGYAETLSHAFDLPDVLRPLETLDLAVAGARVKATEDALGLAVQIRARVHRHDDAADEANTAAPAAAPTTAPSPSATLPPAALARPPTAALAGGWLAAAALTAAATFVMGAGYAIGRRQARRFAWPRLTDIRSAWRR